MRALPQCPATLQSALPTTSSTPNPGSSCWMAHSGPWGGHPHIRVLDDSALSPTDLTTLLTQLPGSTKKTDFSSFSQLRIKLHVMTRHDTPPGTGLPAYTARDASSLCLCFQPVPVPGYASSLCLCRAGGVLHSHMGSPRTVLKSAPFYTRVTSSQ